MSDLLTYTLIRGESTDNGTLGVWRNPDDTFLCFTIERPWLDNAHGVSCIPVGTYSVEPYASPTKGDVWQIMDVPHRSNIEIHPANLASELEGCVAPGDSVGEINHIQAVLNSKKTFAMLKNTLPPTFYLTIK